MNQKKQLETLEVIQATSQKSLYSILNDRFESYTIVEETKKRRFPFVWKVYYTVKVLVPTKVQIQTTSSTEVFSEQLKQQIDSDREEKVILPVTSEKKQTKKRELLERLEQASVSPKEIKTLTVKKQQEVETNQLKAMLEIINDKLSEQKKEEIPYLKKIATILRDSGVEEENIKYYITRAESQFQSTNIMSDGEIYEWLVKETKPHIKIDNQLDITNSRIIALVGQTGVGKTTTIVKIGWQLANKNRSVGFITTDTFRSGAVPQLEGYMEKMGTELIVANGPEELTEAISYFTYVNQVDHILIDTIGRNYMDNHSIDTVKQYLESAKPDLTCLTFSAVYKSKDMLEIISQFKEEEFSGFILTKLDETKTAGGLLSIFMETKKPILFVTDGQDVTKNIYIPSHEILAKRMFRRDVPLSGII